MKNAGRSDNSDSEAENEYNFDSFAGEDAEEDADEYIGEFSEEEDADEDEEEFAAYCGDLEELSYTDMADAAEEAFKPSKSYGDYIVEGLSAETNVSRMTKVTKLPEHIAIYLVSLLYLAVGVLCVSITQKIIDVLPYIVGGMMIAIGLVRFALALKNHEYRHLKTNQTATSLILTALGIMIIIQHFRPENESAITFISISWGILGLFEGAHALNHAFKRIANSERCVFYLIKGIIELAVAFLLLYDPANHETHRIHIIIFGINLIFDSITMLPPVKGLLAHK